VINVTVLILLYRNQLWYSLLTRADSPIKKGTTVNVFDIAWYFEGETAFKDVKHAMIMAPDLEAAKSKWLATEPNAKFLDVLCKSLTA
jgi:hypothetical protein